MKMTRYSEPQILAILRQAEGGVPVAELCREHGMSNASFYKWRAKYGGMDASMVSQLKAMEDENRRLKRMYADLGNVRHRWHVAANCRSVIIREGGVRFGVQHLTTELRLI